jgi:hypothetical protein
MIFDHLLDAEWQEYEAKKRWSGWIAESNRDGEIGRRSGLLSDFSAGSARRAFLA